jgi:hypothetical protein
MGSARSPQPILAASGNGRPTRGPRPGDITSHPPTAAAPGPWCYFEERGRAFYRSLRDRTPLADIGHSIHVYWVDRPWWR